MWNTFLNTKGKEMEQKRIRAVMNRLNFLSWKMYDCFLLYKTYMVREVWMFPAPFPSPDGLQLSWDVCQPLLIPVWTQTIVQFWTLLPGNECLLSCSQLMDLDMWNYADTDNIDGLKPKMVQLLVHLKYSFYRRFCEFCELVPISDACLV